MKAITIQKQLRIVLWLIITFGVTCFSIYVLKKYPKLFPINGFMFAFELHFILMSWYAFTLSFLKLDYKKGYFDLKSFEKEGKVYTYFGVNIFRWFLKIIGWNKISDKSNGTINKSLERLQKREMHTREAELAHAILFIHFLIIAFYFMFTFNVFWLLFLNIIFHVFPVFVQRYNRPRYLKLIAIIKSRN